ncbi:hypothetical protein DCC85_20545 [Paenibacillus sp. CAA11]|uniref:tetratricopeptide repeat protein n=1 Tax=Paenibacillus sp. CAA11 TaxID=1532905 RepID=UPI000D39F743|nr:hypothetical protein [Paenibacillus sp. CAA11]AWB46318.1 hypothetical protein DCC85_20545 [Paenibacillus sp. CAA11]
MSIWATLGIEPTNDSREIKRAYARKLKLFHPESDPAGYQRLREAYDEALQLAKRQAAIPDWDDDDDNDYEEEWPDAIEEQELEEQELGENQAIPRSLFMNDKIPEDEESGDSTLRPFSRNLFIEEEPLEDEEVGDTIIPPLSRPLFWNDSRPDPESEPHPEEYKLNRRNPNDAEEFLSRFEALYHHFQERINKEAWLNLLNDNILWDLEQQERLSEQMLDYLDEHPHLPPSIWQLLDSTFHWSTQAKQHPEQFGELYPDVYSRLNGQRFETDQGYVALGLAGDIDHEEFLSYREEAWQALLRLNYEEAGEHLKACARIFSNEPDLIRLQIHYHRQVGEHELAIQLCGLSIELYPEVRDPYLVRASLLIQARRAPEAKGDIEYLLEWEPDQTDVLHWAGQYHMLQGSFDEARSIYQRLLDRDPRDTHAFVALSHLDADRLKQVKNAEERTRIRQHLNKRPLAERIRDFFISLLAAKWKGIIVLVLLHLFFFNAFTEQTGYSVAGYIREQFKEPEVQLIHDAGELAILDSEHNFVQLTLTDAQYIDLYQVIDEDGVTDYLPLAEAQKRGLFTGKPGYICIGRVADSYVVASLSYEQAKEVNKRGTITVTGNAHPLSASQLDTKLSEWMKERPIQSKWISAYPLASTYIDAQEDPNQQSLPKANGMVWIYAIAAVIYYILILRTARRFWRVMRYN